MPRQTAVNSKKWRSKQNESFRKKESERVKSYYRITQYNKTEEERDEYRTKQREVMRQRRAKKKIAQLENMAKKEETVGDMEEDSQQCSTDQRRKPMTIKLPAFAKSKDHSRKRISKEVSILKYKLRGEERKRQNLQRIHWRLKQSVYRQTTAPITAPSTPLAAPSTPLAAPSTPLAAPSTPLAAPSTPLAAPSTPLAAPSTPQAAPSSSQAAPSTPLTVPSTALAGPSTLAAPSNPLTKNPVIPKHLRLQNAILSALKEAHPAVRTNFLKCKSFKAHRHVSFLARQLNIDRRSIAKSKIFHKQQNTKYDLIRENIIKFYNRADNSVELPGKKDFVTIAGKKVQKKDLTDTLANLHTKYNSENTDGVSQSFFRKCRPRHCKPVKFVNRKVCLCQRHQNFALKLQAIKAKTTNPDSFCEETSIEDTEVILGILPPTVSFEMWKMVETEVSEKTVKRVRLVKCELEKVEFITHFRQQMVDFIDHANRVRAQYSAIHLLKAKLPVNQATIQMDFAENFVCNYTNEVQSAYYNKEQVTLHPMIVHHREEIDGPLLVNSIVGVSHIRIHTAPTIIGFMQQIIPLIKEIVPDLDTIHYWTDSPSSQYRNKSMINICYHHEYLFAVKATWNYFEAGHGKGPCDGVGGTAKRNADLAIKSGVAIQNAQDFYTWASTQSQSKIRYTYLDDEHLVAATTALESLPPIAIVGTAKIHAVLPTAYGLFTKDISCFKDCCWGLSNPTCAWVQQINTNSAIDKDSDTSADEHPFTVDDFVIAKYDGQAYVGKILTIDSNQNEYSVDFMETLHGPSFRWPARKDIVFRSRQDIVCKISAPTKQGRFKRLFHMSKEEVSKAEKCLGMPIY